MLAAVSIAVSTPCSARTPGSEDVDEALAQIKDAAVELRKLQQNWASFAVIDAEGRAGNNVDAARRILGGVAPQRGEAAGDPLSCPRLASTAWKPQPQCSR